MEEILFNNQLETTPEDLLPIIECLVKDLMDQVFLFVGEIEVRLVTKIRQVEIDIGNGKALVSRPEKSLRPENIGIVFFGTLIGVFDVIQTNRFPSVSNVVSKLLVSPDSFKVPNGLGGYKDSKYVMNYLISGIQEKIQPYYKNDNSAGQITTQIFVQSISQVNNHTIVPIAGHGRSQIYTPQNGLNEIQTIDPSDGSITSHVDSSMDALATNQNNDQPAAACEKHESIDLNDLQKACLARLCGNKLIRDRNEFLSKWNENHDKELDNGEGYHTLDDLKKGYHQLVELKLAEMGSNHRWKVTETGKQFFDKWSRTKEGRRFLSK